MQRTLRFKAQDRIATTRRGDTVTIPGDAALAAVCEEGYKRAATDLEETNARPKGWQPFGPAFAVALVEFEVQALGASSPPTSANDVDVEHGLTDRFGHGVVPDSYLVIGRVGLATVSDGTRGRERWTTEMMTLYCTSTAGATVRMLVWRMGA